MSRWWLVLLVGCYRPAEIESCYTVCGSDPGRACPPGQECDGNGICKPEGMDGNCAPLPPDSNVTPDAFEFADAPVDADMPAQTCFGNATHFFRVCVDTPGNAETITGTTVISTSNCVQNQTQSAPPAVCVRAWRDLTISAGATLRIEGQRPLAIVVLGNLQIDGTIDVASHRGLTQGANANVGDCDPAGGGAPAIGASNGAGGGAGGALAGGGGGGGKGYGGSPGGLETPAIDPMKLLRVRGGCPGGNGGKSTTGLAGTGGAGGGAIYLMANGMITLGATAVINASGAGGNPPGERGGGGGGGSGGFIGFHSPMYVVVPTAQVFAIGGSGSSGGGSSMPGKGGNEATSVADPAITLGVGGSGFGGAGSSGKGGPAEQGGLNTGGGGGGGGGGVIGFEGQMPPDGRYAPMPRQL